jgi:hypothetical protein
MSLQGVEPGALAVAVSASANALRLLALKALIRVPRSALTSISRAAAPISPIASHYPERQLLDGPAPRDIPHGFKISPQPCQRSPKATGAETASSWKKWGCQFGYPLCAPQAIAVNLTNFVVPTRGSKTPPGLCEDKGSYWRYLLRDAAGQTNQPYDRSIRELNIHTKRGPKGMGSRGV